MTPPETTAIKTAHVAEAVAAIEAGLEYARECLQVHETNLGRTTYKNRTWAETMEADIKRMTDARLCLLPSAHGISTPQA